MTDSPRKLAYDLRPCDIPRGEAVTYFVEHTVDRYQFFARQIGTPGLARVVPSKHYGRQFADMMITSSAFRFTPIEDWVGEWVTRNQSGEQEETPEQDDLAEACRILVRFVRSRTHKRVIESRYFTQAERLLRRRGIEW